MMTVGRKAILACTLAITTGVVRADPGDTWKMFQFLGGPPHIGQVTDTLEITDLNGHFRLELKRDITGEKSAEYCVTRLKDTTLEKKLKIQLRDSKLNWIFDHSAELPRLIPDSGYFLAENKGRSIFAGTPPGTGNSPEIVAALNTIAELNNTYSVLIAYMLKQKTCKHIAAPR